MSDRLFCSKKPFPSVFLSGTLVCLIFMSAFGGLTPVSDISGVSSEGLLTRSCFADDVKNEIKSNSSAKRTDAKTDTISVSPLQKFGDFDPISEEFAPLFPFLIGKGAQKNITDIRTWRSEQPAISPIRVEGEHFVNDQGEIRFLGVNLCFSASFPSQEEAVRLAQTLARFGINVVRLHHMDSRDIWGKNVQKNITDIDPERLDRLDFLIDQLHRQGIYVNINLHVSRTLDERAGMLKHQDYPDAHFPDYNKGLDNFEPKMIEFQKNYARDLLTHINPYTGFAYTDDPGIAMIEINNENSILCSWACNDLDRLPAPYAQTFQELWNSWLLKKYGDTKALRKAWKSEVIPYSDEMFPEAQNNFGRKTDLDNSEKSFQFPESWKFQLEPDVKTSLSVSDSGKAVKIKVLKKGNTSYLPQIFRPELALEKGKPYELKFRARAAKPVQITVNACRAHTDWNNLGLSDSLPISTDWKEYSLTFTAKEDEKNARISWTSFEEGLELELADLSFRQGGVLGLAPELSLEEKSVPIVAHQLKSSSQTEEMRNDMIQFMIDVETKYWSEMFRYIKDDLKAKPPVSGTQLQYGSFYAQAELDYCDIHSYWNHPSFPHKSWDMSDWYIENRALVNLPFGAGSTLNHLSAVRVLGKPLTVSEYNHPFPNVYGAECLPMLTSIAAFQDWSGLYHFAWAHGTTIFESPKVSGFFDLSAHQVQLAHLPAAYAIFCRKDVQKGHPELQRTFKSMSRSEQLEIFQNHPDGYHRSLQTLQFDYPQILATYSGLELSELPASSDFVRSIKLKSQKSAENAQKSDAIQTDIAQNNSVQNDLVQNGGKRIVSETGELLWDTQTDKKGYFQVDSNGTWIFSGFVDGREFVFEPLELIPGKNRLDWLTFSLVKTDKNADSFRASKKPTPLTAQESRKKTGQKTLGPGTYLLAATGLMINSNSKYEVLQGERLTIQSAWGDAPILCEGISAEIRFQGTPERVRFYALDENGNRSCEIQPKKIQRKAQNDLLNAHLTEGVSVSISPEYKTLWYELVILP